MSALVFRPEKLFRYKKPPLLETEISPTWQCVRHVTISNYSQDLPSRAQKLMLTC